MHRSGNWLSLAVVLPSVMVLFSLTARAASNSLETSLSDARVDAIAADQTSIDLTAYPPGTPYHLLVRDTASQGRLKDFQKGDHLSVQMTTDGNGQNVFETAAIKALPITPRRRLWVLLLTAAGFLLISALLVRDNPMKLILGEDQRYSNSKFQMALWFAVAITTYVATVWLRAGQLGLDFLSSVNIPQNLLLLSGMSAFTFAAAKGITTSKIQSAIENGVPAPKPPGKPRLFYDLTHNDSGQLDFGDFQMLVITLVAAAIYCVLIFHFMGSLEMRRVVTLPDVDTTILAAFGIGQGAYLTKKAVGEVARS